MDCHRELHSREHYLDLSADEYSPAKSGAKKHCSFSLDEFVERLSGEAALLERVVCVEEYVEPVRPFRIGTVPMMLFTLLCTLGATRLCTHHYVAVETLTWWWSFEQCADGTMIMQRAKNFTNVQARCRGAYRDYRRLVDTGPRLVRGKRYRKGPRMEEIVTDMLKKGVFEGGNGSPSSCDVPRFVFNCCKKVPQ